MTFFDIPLGLILRGSLLRKAALMRRSSSSMHAQTVIPESGQTNTSGTIQSRLGTIKCILSLFDSTLAYSSTFGFKRTCQLWWHQTPRPRHASKELRDRLFRNAQHHETPYYLYNCQPVRVPNELCNSHNNWTTSHYNYNSDSSVFQQPDRSL